MTKNDLLYSTFHNTWCSDGYTRQRNIFLLCVPPPPGHWNRSTRGFNESVWNPIAHRSSIVYNAFPKATMYNTQSDSFILYSGKNGIRYIRDNWKKMFSNRIGNVSKKVLVIFPPEGNSFLFPVGYGSMKDDLSILYTRSITVRISQCGAGKKRKKNPGKVKYITRFPDIT